jgi:4-amino-4-deoxy-L-arabinose transferase-like glycosyltransferase
MTAADHPHPRHAAARSSGGAGFALWRSPDGQPPWARPALLAVAALAALSYGWNIAAQQPEIFYATAVRSMSMSWHNFFFAAFDPRATVSIDKLPGALWLQVLSVRLFGLHLWALNLPQAIEGTLTVLVLYRAVRRLTGPGVAIVAVVVCACTPATVGLNRGNVSDSLLVLLLVLAADAASAAVVTGRVRSLLLAGLWVGLAFQAKMLEAWLIVPSLLVIWLLAAPAGWRRRLLAAAGMAAVTLVVSLSWMLAVTAVPHGDRPYVDGSQHDSLFAQVFEYNGFSRADSPSTLPTNVAHISVGLATLDNGSRADRVVAAAGGRDIGWLLPLAAAGLLAGLYATRRRRPGDPLRAACLLWGTWLVIDIGAFVTTNTINAYYLGALTPPIAALSAIAVASAWEHRAEWWTRLIVVLVAGAAIGYAYWLLAPAPSLIRALALGGAVLLCAAGVLFGRTAALAGLAAVLVAPAVASVALVTENGGPFNTPYEPAAARAVTQADVAQSIITGERADAVLVKGEGTRYVAAAYTSLLASPLIYPTGDEILPIGGFTGRQPSPTLSQLQADFASGRLHIVIFSATRDQRMRWVMAHCINITVKSTGLLAYYCK